MIKATCTVAIFNMATPFVTLEKWAYNSKKGTKCIHSTAEVSGHLRVEGEWGRESII